MNALDIGNESTCWNSDGQADGELENIFVLHFHRDVQIDQIKIQFQGGFVAEECVLFTAKKSGDNTNGSSLSWREIEDAYIEPENINSIQDFSLEEVNEGHRQCNTMKLSFESSSDFYGRVIIYKLEVWGKEI